MPVKVASEWLNSCSGCEISVLDMGERLLDILAVADFVHIPALMDSKYFGQLGDGKHLDIPQADVGIISGGIRNEEHLEVAKVMRERCGFIIALGTCATHGGIPSLANSYTPEQIFERYYHTETTDPADFVPNQGLPALLESCDALDQHIKVDLLVPGCPPHPDHIFSALVALVKGEAPALPEKSVCDACPTKREGKGDLAKKLKRFLEAPEYGAPDEPLDQMRCLLEQGFLCMGPVTRAGCGGDGILPRCISARVPCRGCYGPVRPEGNQRLDMLNALASNGIDVTTLPESASMLRFSGAHGRLRPARPKES
ncbi:F420-non-reducing hydrogenase small subunit [Desulfatibacillum alkenivorans DSM 16219]|uniref:F420-non-reducing hydrogenase small subunit n=1 Tax=Desulfatibacillum alkenivorans DSM 16219 TaxID=1121393 RepID=A0A1M6YCI6_9BACT|nr:methyl viologen-reducing hydrogenase [Desulfatibacillum alkenivorans]SHL16024.1 F420-non-reducing hydrogenase small subunit [Desulfatibacillum alkenivorans DSM 16219]